MQLIRTCTGWTPHLGTKLRIRDKGEGLREGKAASTYSRSRVKQVKLGEVDADFTYLGSPEGSRSFMLRLIGVIA